MRHAWCHQYCWKSDFGEKTYVWAFVLPAASKIEVADFFEFEILGKIDTPTPLNKKTVPAQEDPSNFLFYEGLAQDRASFLISIFLFLHPRAKSTSLFWRRFGRRFAKTCLTWKISGWSSEMSNWQGYDKSCGIGQGTWTPCICRDREIFKRTSPPTDLSSKNILQKSWKSMGSNGSIFQENASKVRKPIGKSIAVLFYVSFAVLLFQSYNPVYICCRSIFDFVCPPIFVDALFFNLVDPAIFFTVLFV